MIRILSLSLLLTTTLSTMAQAEEFNWQRAYIQDGSGNRILDGQGHCIRSSAFIELGSPLCFPTPLADTSSDTVTTAPTNTAAANEDESDAQALANEQTAPVTTVQTVVQNTATQALAETIIPNANPTNSTPAEPEAAITYSYVTEQISTNIYFDFDKNNLRIAEQVKLERAINKAQAAHDLLKVSIAGHADSRGTDAYNYNLSQRRINTVVNYLNLRSVQTNSTFAWGESQLVRFADGTENFDHSRRAEVVFKVRQKVQD